MRADAILFDKDGTLFLFEATWEAWAEAVLLRFTDGDRARATELGQAIGFDLPNRRFARDSVVIAGTPEEIVGELEQLLDLPGDQIEDILNEEAARAPQVEAVPLAPFLNDLRARGLKLGVATNDAETPARAHLDSAGVTGLLDYVSGYDSGHGSKPDAGPCLAFARFLGLDPSRVVMVGDSLHDLHAGRAAGMQTVAVLTGLATDAELGPFADVVLPDIGALPGWLSQAG